MAKKRGSMLDKDVRDRVVEGVGRGLSTELVCDLVGVAHSTVAEWLTVGRKVVRDGVAASPHEKLCHAFTKDHDAAKAGAAENVLGYLIAAAKKGDARSAQWLFEKLYGMRYLPRMSAGEATLEVGDKSVRIIVSELPKAGDGAPKP